MRNRTLLALMTLLLGLHAVAAEGPSSAAMANKATPRTADGRPELAGFWNGGRGGGGAGGLKDDGSVHASYPARDSDVNNFERDFAVQTRAHTNKPIYKPEYWATIQDMDWNGLTRDPTFSCGALGVPRLGAPDKIVQSSQEIIFLYENGVYRIIPTDGRTHDPQQVGDTTPNGYSVGRWEGDTLVIESVGFDDVTWLNWTGYLHSNEMKVTERVTRSGDTLQWVATVEDDMLQEPWTMDPIVRRLNADPKAWFWGALPCKERDADNIVDRNVRG
jgi:hypothetical protein